MGFGDPETTYVRLKIHTPDEPNMFNEYNVSMRRADTYMHDTRVLAETNERDIDVIQAQLAQVTYTKNGTTTLVNQIHEQTPTVPDTFPTLRVTDLRTYGMGGRLVEGVFCITNSGASAVTIAAETVFATGLSTKANESYTAFVDFAPSQVVTLETNGTGKSINLTTALTVPASGSRVLYVIANPDTRG